MSMEFIKHLISFIIYQLNQLSFVLGSSLGDITKSPSLDSKCEY